MTEEERSLGLSVPCSQCSLVKSRVNSGDITADENIVIYLIPGLVTLFIATRWSLVTILKWRRETIKEEEERSGLPPTPSNKHSCSLLSKVPWEGVTKLCLAIPAIIGISLIHLQNQMSDTRAVMVTILLFVCLSGCLDLIAYYWGYRVIPEGSQSFILCIAFTVEAISYGSLEARFQGEVQIVRLLILAISATALSACLETIFDNKLVKFCRCLFSLLQSTWSLHAARLAGKDAISDQWTAVLFLWHLGIIFLLLILFLLISLQNSCRPPAHRSALLLPRPRRSTSPTCSASPSPQRLSSTSFSSTSSNTNSPHASTHASTQFEFLQPNAILLPPSHPPPPSTQQFPIGQPGQGSRASFRNHPGFFPPTNWQQQKQQQQQLQQCGWNWLGGGHREDPERIQSSAAAGENPSSPTVSQASSFRYTDFGDQTRRNFGQTSPPAAASNPVGQLVTTGLSAQDTLAGQIEVTTQSPIGLPGLNGVSHHSPVGLPGQNRVSHHSPVGLSAQQTKESSQQKLSGGESCRIANSGIESTGENANNDKTSECQPEPNLAQHKKNAKDDIIVVDVEPIDKM